MGKVTTLLAVVQDLDSLNKEEIIYAAKPWSLDSKAFVLQEPESGGLPAEAEKSECSYFLEVFIALDFIQDWEASLDSVATDEQKCSQLVQYAINDA